MKALAAICMTIILTGGIVRSARTDDDTNAARPHAAFGFAVSAAEYNAWERKKSENHERYKFAPGFGGGFVFEKMFNNTLGLQSGIWVNRIGVDMSMKQPLNPLSYNSNNLLSYLIAMNFKVDAWSIGIPFALVTSLNASIFSFNILAGLKYSQIVETKLKFNPLMRLMALASYTDLMPYMNNPQIAFTLGINFKFRVGRFVDLFFGCGGGLNVTELTKGNDNIALLFDVNIAAGLMFRTDVFPIKN